MALNLLLVLTFFSSITFASTGSLSKFAPHKLRPSVATAHTRAPETGVFSQTLDHFNIFDGRHFNQRYVISSDNAVSANSPVLFFICGETECGSDWLPTINPWAASLHAHVVLIEHRYYGQSQPFPQLTASTLKYLTIPQAIEDFAHVVGYLKNKRGLTGPWVVMGGSYGGMLASAFRLKHPELVRGAWASSAPWNVTEFYSGYDKKMAQIMGEPCASQLRAVVHAAEVAVKDPTSFSQIRHLFGSDTLTDPQDFLFSISDVAAAAVQFGYTPLLCNNLNVADPVQGYGIFSQQSAATEGYLPTSYSFASATDTTAGGPQSDSRAFFYQQCNEEGFFQTAYPDVNISVRSQSINDDYMKNGCQRLFGKSFKAKISQLHENYYNPLIYSPVSEIYFSNGSSDPFMPLGIADELGNWKNPNVYAQVITSGAHCDDITFDYAPSEAHKAAHVEIELLLQKWTR